MALDGCCGENESGRDDVEFRSFPGFDLFRKRPIHKTARNADTRVRKNDRGLE